MNITLKKIIAREFLTLIMVLVCVLITFLCIYPYNIIVQRQVEKTSAKILEKTKLADSLSSTYKIKLDKQNWLFEKFRNYFDVDNSKYWDQRDELWERLDELAVKDSIKYVWVKEDITFFKSVGFSNSKSLQAFIEKNRINKVDSLKFDSSLVINSEIVLLSKNKKVKEGKIISHNEQIEIAMKTLFFCLVVFFGIRYLFYSIKWSFNVLKQ
jgi:hypothetical protein